MFRKILTYAVLTVAGCGAALAADAPAPAVKATELQRYEIPDGNKMAVVVLTEVPAGGKIGAHTHFGVEIGYVLEGTATISIAGKSDLKRGPGESFQIPAGAVHRGVNTGSGVFKVITTFVVEKDKPLRTAAE